MFVPYEALNWFHIGKFTMCPGSWCNWRSHGHQILTALSMQAVHAAQAGWRRAQSSGTNGSLDLTSNGSGSGGGKMTIAMKLMKQMDDGWAVRRPGNGNAHHATEDGQAIVPLSPRSRWDRFRPETGALLPCFRYEWFCTVVEHTIQM
jgi:hypothetical protein